jgi:hypothetical protein
LRFGVRVQFDLDVHCEAVEKTMRDSRQTVLGLVNHRLCFGEYIVSRSVGLVYRLCREIAPPTHKNDAMITHTNAISNNGITAALAFGNIG